MTSVSFQGSKGGSSSFKQTPDNLRSTDTFEGVLGMGIGPMAGPVNGMKSVKLNGTAVEDDTGDLNFDDFIIQFGDGDPAKFPQTIQLKLGAGASPDIVGLSITNEPPDLTTRPSGPGPWIAKTTTAQGADFIDFRFVVEELYRQDSKGIYDEILTLDIEMKPSGATTWINPSSGVPTGTYNEQGGTKADVVRTLIPQSYYNTDGTWKASTTGYQVNGKTTSDSVYELRVAVPNTGAYENVTWDTRVRLEETDHFDDGNGNIEYRTLQWESVSSVFGSTMGDTEGWRGVTWMQLYGKASDQLTGVPAVLSEWKTKIVSVPPATVFNPDTRQYAAGVTWDGSWSLSYTNDPAWVINDAISDSLAGLSLVASGSYMNKWDALEVSKWCSTLVPDGGGTGGMEPRYSLNLAINDQQKAEDFIRYLSGAVGALAWDQGDGEWRMKVDKPEAPVDIFTLESITGEFIYSHTDVDTRYNDVVMQFLNKENNYQQDSVHLYDDVSIALIGRKPTTVVAVGCTGRQEALRRGMLRLRSAVNEARIVTFTTNRRGRNVQQLDTILVADSDLGDSTKKTTGRMVGLSADRKTIMLRDPVYLAPGIAYQINYAAPNPDYNPESTVMPPDSNWTKPTLVYTANITNSGSLLGSTRQLVLDAALVANTATNLNIGLSAVGLPTIPKLYRVTSVETEDDGETMGLSAIEVDTGKWDAADNVTNTATVFKDLHGLPPVPLPPESPTPVCAMITTPTDTGVVSNLLVQWVRPVGSFIGGFRVQYSLNGAILQTGIASTQIPNFELVNPVSGIYNFEICTIDRNGKFSAPLRATYVVGAGPDQTKPALADVWKEGEEFVATHTYTKGDIVADQGATWLYQNNLSSEGSPPPTLPVSSNDYWIQIKDATSSSLNLDSLSVNLTADYTGALTSGQLPTSGQASFVVGTADVSSAATWSIGATSSCSATIDTDGTWTLTAATLTGYFDVVGVYNGLSLTKRIPVTVTNAAAPAGTPTGSSLTQFDAETGSYPPSPIQTVTTSSGTAGKIAFAGTLRAKIPIHGSASGSAYMYGKIVYRLSGGTTWTDADAEVAASVASMTPYPEPGSQPGVLTFGFTLTGLTASSNYEWGVLLRLDTGSSAVSVTGSITGTTTT